MLEWYEAYADYRDTMARIEELRPDGRRWRLLGTTGGVVPRPRGRLRPGRGAGCTFVESLEQRELWTDGRGRAARVADRARRRHEAGHDLGAARRPRVLALRRARADRADDRPRLPGGAVAVRAHDRRRPALHRAVRVLRRRDGARQRVLRDQRRRGAGRALRRRRRGSSVASRATRTTSRRLRTACRRRAVSVSGIDRLAMVLTGRETIRDVILFPALKERT